MRLTIVVDDKVVTIDGETYGDIDMSDMPSNVSAVQWYDTHGEVEYFSTYLNGHNVKPENTVILSIDDYQFAIDAHAQAKADAEEQ